MPRSQVAEQSVLVEVEPVAAGPARPKSPVDKTWDGGAPDRGAAGLAGCVNRAGRLGQAPEGDPILRDPNLVCSGGLTGVTRQTEYNRRMQEFYGFKGLVSTYDVPLG